MKTKFHATVITMGVVSIKLDVMPPFFFEAGFKVNTEVYLDLLNHCCETLDGPGGSWEALHLSAGWGARPQPEQDLAVVPGQPLLHVEEGGLASQLT